MMPKKYPIAEEKLIQLANFDPPPAPSKRLKARHACASDHAQFAWMRFDVCVSRGKGELPPGLTRVHSSADSAKMFRAFGGVAHIELREIVSVLLVDGRNSPLGFAIVSLGGISSAAVGMQQLFKPAVLLPAPALIMCHNHPSGDKEPSEADIDLTKRAVQAGRLLGVHVLDHIILTKDSYTSLLDRGLM